MRDPRGVVTITFDNPAKRNALTLAAMAHLHDQLIGLVDDPGVRAVVLTGAGDVFSAGADRDEVADPGNLQHATVLLTALLDVIDRLEVPVVSRVPGPAFGAGLALVAASDISVVAEGTRFGFPEVRYGMVAGPALAAARRRIGETALHDLFLTGRQFDAAEAVRLGLVTRSVPRDQLVEVTDVVVANLLLGDRAAIAATRRLIRAGVR